MTLETIKILFVAVGIILALITAVIKIKAGSTPVGKFFLIITILDFLVTGVISKAPDITEYCLSRLQPTIEGKREDGYTLVTLANSNGFHFGDLYYSINHGEDVLYEEPFPVGESCTVSAYSKLLFIQTEPVSKTFSEETDSSIRADYIATLGSVGAVALEIKISPLADALNTYSMFGLGNGRISFDREKIQIAGMGPGNLFLKDSDGMILLDYPTNEPTQAIRQDGQGSSSLNSMDDRIFIDTPEGTIILTKNALRELLDSTQDVSISLKRAYRRIEFSITSGGEIVDQVSGGVILSMEGFDCGPGTVAALSNDGELLTIQKSVVNKGHTIIPLDGSADIEIIDNNKIFSDISKAKWAEDAIAFVVSHELIDGSSNEFSPDAHMIRAFMTTMLYNLEGKPEESSSFKDVSDKNWYAASAYWAKNHGIVVDNDGRFNAGEELLREQLIVMLWRYAGCPASQADDFHYGDFNKTSDYARPAMLWAAEAGIIGAGSNFRPRDVATRAEAAQMMKLFCELRAISSVAE